MTSVLVTLATLLVAIVISRVTQLTSRVRTLLVASVLILPIAWTLPATLRHEGLLIRKDLRLTPIQAEVEPPVRWTGYSNTALLLGIRKIVPVGATMTFLPGGRLTRGLSPSDARTGYLETGWVRWVAFVIAPRRVVDDVDARWVVLADESPATAGVRPRRAWRFGRDWLIQR
jgi:hypothetical protein